MRPLHVIEEPTYGHAQVEYQPGIWIRARQALVRIIAPNAKERLKGQFYAIRHLLAGQEFECFFTSDSLAEALPQGGALVPATAVRSRLEQLHAAPEVLGFFDRRVADSPYLYLRSDSDAYEEIVATVAENQKGGAP